jgi:type I restriction enzyme S subunit
MVPLGEVLDFQNGRAFKKTEWTDSGLPIIRIQNINDPEKPFNYFEGEFDDRILIRNGDLLFAWSASLGPHIWDRGDAVLNQHIFLVSPKPNIDQQYAYYALLFISDDLEKKTNGAIYGHITKTQLLAHPIPLPPLSEQRRIVSVLDAAFAGLATATAHTQKNLQNARELFETHLLLTIKRAVEQWGLSKVSDVCKVTSGGTPSKKEPRYWNGDIPWVTAKDLKTDRINTSIDKITKLGASSSSTKIAPVGSVLMLVRGMGLANGLQVGEVTRDVAFNQDVRALIPDERLRPRFLFHQLKATPTEALLSSAAHGTLKIDADKLRALPLSLPPVDEQDAMLKSIDAVQSHSANLVRSATRKLAALSELKQSLLHRAFRGELSGGAADGVLTEATA